MLGSGARISLCPCVPGDIPVNLVEMMKSCVTPVGLIRAGRDHDF